MSTHRVALVTGAASGIGLASAEILLKDGVTVVLADRSENVTAIAHALAERTSGHAVGMVVDLAAESQVLQLARDVIASHGTVGILINNAGIHPKVEGRKFPLEDITSDQWARVMAINLTAPFLLSRELLPNMREHGWGRVINIASSCARTVIPSTSAAYVSSKHGLIGLTQMCAHEYAPFGVTVNAIAPGPVRTGLTNQTSAAHHEMLARTVPMGRYGEPVELALVVRFLASEDASFMTGAVLDVNGGSVIV